MEVIPGIADPGYVQVLFPELFPDDIRIVTRGAFYILLKTAAGTEDE